MTETVELVDGPTVAPAATEPARPNRLFQVAAWVAIVAGILFIVGTVFFAGFFMGRHSGHGHGGWHHRGGGGHSEFRMMSPGMGPGQMGPGQMGPGRQPGPMPGATESPASSVPQRPSP